MWLSSQFCSVCFISRSNKLKWQRASVGWLESLSIATRCFPAPRERLDDLNMPACAIIAHVTHARLHRKHNNIDTKESSTGRNLRLTVNTVEMFGYLRSERFSCQRKCKDRSVVGANFTAFPSGQFPPPSPCVPPLLPLPTL